MTARSIGRSQSASVELESESPVDVRTNNAVVDIRDHAAPKVYERRTVQDGQLDSERPAQLRRSKFFGSPAFRRLWIAQVFSALGDWIGFIAITAIATRIGGATLGLGAVSIVLAARLIPGFFFAPFAGVLIDRYNRKHIMVWCDFGRALVLCALPFVNNLVGLFVVSLVLELFTSLWSPAKESSVPHLVDKDFLPTANSMSLVAAYGTFPFASAVFAVLATVPDWLDQSKHLASLNLTKESVALYFDALTYVLSAAVIATLAIPHTRREADRSSDVSRTVAGWNEAREGWQYIGQNPRIRSVIIGLATGLVGGGMLVPLGVAYANVALSAGSGGYGLLLTAMGVGVALGIVGLTVLQKRVPIDQAFCIAIFGAGVTMIVAATMTGLAAAAICIGILGIFAGAIYVLGFTSVQVNTKDEMRGRVFATLYTLTRVCILFAFLIGPLLSIGLGRLARAIFGPDPELPWLQLPLPGVRVTLWLAGLIIICAGMLAVRSLHRPAKVEAS